MIEPIRLTCPNGHALKVDRSAAGKRLRCPKDGCGALVLVLQSHEEPPVTPRLPESALTPRVASRQPVASDSSAGQRVCPDGRGVGAVAIEAGPHARRPDRGGGTATAVPRKNRPGNRKTPAWEWAVLAAFLVGTVGLFASLIIFGGRPNSAAGMQDEPNSPSVPTGGVPPTSTTAKAGAGAAAPALSRFGERDEVQASRSPADSSQPNNQPPGRPGNGGVREWKQESKAFAEAVARGEALERGASIEWAAEFLGLVGPEEQFVYDGVTAGGNGSVEFRDQRPRGIHLRTVDLRGHDGTRGDIWFGCSDRELAAWKAVTQGQKIRFSAKFDGLVLVRHKVNNDGSTEGLPYRFAVLFEHTVPFLGSETGAKKQVSQGAKDTPAPPKKRSYALASLTSGMSSEAFEELLRDHGFTIPNAGMSQRGNAIDGGLSFSDFERTCRHKDTGLEVKLSVWDRTFHREGRSERGCGITVDGRHDGQQLMRTLAQATHRQLLTALDEVLSSATAPLPRQPIRKEAGVFRILRTSTGKISLNCDLP